MPDVTMLLEDFELAVDKSDEICEGLKARGAAYMIIAGDFQRELPPGIKGFTGPDAYGRPLGTDYWDWCELVFVLLKKWQLGAVNTWINGEDARTRIPWGRTHGEGRQIDYIFMSSRLGCR